MHGLSIPKTRAWLEKAVKISSFVAGILCLALSPIANAQGASDLFDKMTLEQRVGQIFIWTYPGTAMNTQTEKWLMRFQPGALIVFSRNIKSLPQIAKYNSDLQKFALKKMKVPFFLMVDQEGGTVTRLRTKVPLPSALALGQMEDRVFTENFGKALATVLKSVGFNVNLAPVLDISDPNSSSFIGNRTFGEDPNLVAERAGAFAEGISEAGVLPTAKHFPGHGGVTQDSHQTMPKKLATFDELAAKDLVPFADYAAAEFPRAIMMAHMALPNIDPTGQPSTYSSVLIQEHLRGKLEYDGLIITDDLEMAGASGEYGIGERAVRAFLAGNDMLMLAGSSGHQQLAFKAVLSAVKSGRISAARLKASVDRILAYKQKLALGTFAYNEKQTKAHIATLEDLSRQILHKNFRQALEAQTAPWPAIDSDTHVLVLSSDRRFFEAFKHKYKGDSRFFLLTPKSLEQAAGEIAKEKYTAVVYYASGVQTARWLTRLKAPDRAKTIVINANHAAEVEAQNMFHAVLNINSHFPDGGSELGEAMNSPEIRAPAQQSPPEE
jgi:beta-N-acetylhexosaminidase